MRNLKRALSLALASVMLLGMMVVGSSAKGIDDFTDKAEIVNQDAVAVTSAIGMFEGYEDGSFGPENVVTRAEMAVIICTMLYGAGVNVNQFAETNVFTDVPAWAQGYVNLCSSLGIVAGVGDGKFDPNATVTTAQAVLMLCRALGYFQSAADFGSDWMLAATAKGTALGLYGDLKLTANAGLTRDNVAELVFNALTKAVPVQYNELLGVYYNENQGIIYSLEFNYLQTLGYKNFDLVYRTDTERSGCWTRTRSSPSPTPPTTSTPTALMSLTCMLIWVLPCAMTPAASRLTRSTPGLPSSTVRSRMMRSSPGRMLMRSGSTPTRALSWRFTSTTTPWT